MDFVGHYFYKVSKKKVGAPPKTNEEFLKRIKELNNGIEILEEYKGYHKSILFKNKYGLCKVQPGTLLKGMTGSLVSAIDKTAYMIEQFKEKHNNNKYTYPNYSYCGNRCKSLIQCPIHGEFYQLTDFHLMGSGCKECGKTRINGFSRTDFVNMSNGRNAIYYIIKCWNKEEEFYKLGITSRSVKIRYREKLLMPYNYESIFEYTSSDPEVIWDLEKRIKKKYKSFKMLPNLHFKGSQECFLLTLPIKEIIASFK